MHKLQVRNEEKSYVQIGNIKIDITDKSYRDDHDKDYILEQVFMDMTKSIPECVTDWKFSINEDNSIKANGKPYHNARIKLEGMFMHKIGGEKFPITIVIDCLQPQNWKLQIVGLRLKVSEDEYQEDRKLLMRYIKAILEANSDCFKY